jgi:hypothetical protein
VNLGSLEHRLDQLEREVQRKEPAPVPLGSAAELQVLLQCVTRAELDELLARAAELTSADVPDGHHIELDPAFVVELRGRMGRGEIALGSCWRVAVELGEPFTAAEAAAFAVAVRERQFVPAPVYPQLAQVAVEGLPLAPRVTEGVSRPVAASGEETAATTAVELKRVVPGEDEPADALPPPPPPVRRRESAPVVAAGGGGVSAAAWVSQRSRTQRSVVDQLF